jgi:DNA-binding NtrC family response regulator
VITPDLLGIVPAPLAFDGPRSPRAEATVTLPLGLALKEVERRYVEATLAAMKGNRTKAAEALGVGRNTLKRKAKQG